MINAIREDKKLLRSIKSDGNYNNASFFSGVVQMTTKMVFNEPAWITLIRIKP